MFHSTLHSLMFVAFGGAALLAQDGLAGADVTPVAPAAIRAAAVVNPNPIRLELDGYKGKLHADVSSSESKFLGAVILSASPDLRQFAVGLPPMLHKFAVMGVATAQNGRLEFSVPTLLPFDQIAVYGQALALDARGLHISEVVRVCPAAR